MVLPRDIDDVAAAVAVCHEHGAPLVNRGGGTSLGGQCANTAVVIDFSKYVRGVEQVVAATRRAVVRAGTVLDGLNEAGPATP